MATITQQNTLDLNFKIRHIFSKRLFDILFSVFAIIILSPVYLLIAMAIYITSKGPVFYTQNRIGRGGKSFQCLKFRTMYPNADEHLESLIASNKKIQQEWETKRKLKDDPRITAVGHLLRKTSLDELPQFWNVLKGDLSVVGPRPIVAEEVARHYGMKAGKILSIRPGLTGLWQVSGRSDTTYNQRVKLDEKYVDTRTLKLDLKLIAKTIPCMIQSKGAY